MNRPWSVAGSIIGSVVLLMSFWSTYLLNRAPVSALLLLILLLAILLVGLMWRRSAPPSDAIKVVLWVMVGLTGLAAAFWAVAWVPLELVVGLAVVLTVAVAGLVWWRYNPNAVASDLAVHSCQTCGYDLRASMERCPECGADLPEDLARRRRIVEEIRRQRAERDRAERSLPNPDPNAPRH